MRFTAAVASGQTAVESLRKSCASELLNGDVTFQEHGHLAVAWSSTCRWVDSSDDGEVLVVVDGRLHNLWSASAGPAELLVQRYRSDGVQVASGLLGDFVLVVLDRVARRLVVARDPVGVRPWYQATAGRSHAGAADLAAIASLPWVHTSVNEPIAIEYLAAMMESRGETLYTGISTLRPGRTWHTDATSARTFSHHRWVLEPDLDISWEDAVDRCRAVFDEALAARLRVTGAATAELSGGLDSSTVVGSLAQLGRDNLLVGRLLFDDPRTDERAFSDTVIDHWRLRAVSVPPWIPSQEELEDLTRQLRRPPPEPNYTMFTSLHRALLAEGRYDGLTGLGGDDAFIRMGMGQCVVSTVKLRQGTMARELARWVAHNPRRAWPELLRPTVAHLTAPWRPDRSRSWVSQSAAARVGLSRLLRSRPEAITGVAAIDERLGPLTSGHLASTLEDGAVTVDLGGRRVSHPFLDPRFIRATYGLDPWWPVRGDQVRALQVAAFGDRLPPEIASRRSKAEFSGVFWPQVLTDSAVASLRSGPLVDAGWHDPQGLDDLIARARLGVPQAAIPLSRCVSLNRWLASL